MKKLITLMLLGLLSAELGWAFAEDPDRIFTASAGGAATFHTDSADKSMEVYIKVESDACKSVSADFCVVIARGHASGSAFTNGVSTVDLDYDLVGGEFRIGEDHNVGVGVSAFNVVYQRNVAIDQEKFVRLSILGFRLHGRWRPIAENQNVEIFGKLAVDLLAIGYSQNTAQVRTATGTVQGFNAEIGARFFKRVSISVAEQFSMLTG